VLVFASPIALYAGRGLFCLLLLQFYQSLRTKELSQVRFGGTSSNLWDNR
jgi:hypothetical protein